MQAVRRVAYVDVDAHHGDGVYYGVADGPELNFVDLHEDGRYLYPGTGSADETDVGPAVGTKLNFPLPPGSDDRAFHDVSPQVEDFVRNGKSEFMILQAGASSIAGNPLTHMQFSPAAHGHATQRLSAFADELYNGRLIATGGGGHHHSNLAAAWYEVVQGMI